MFILFLLTVPRDRELTKTIYRPRSTLRKLNCP